jgi:uncharacterized protein YbjT (DUF2867 family)
MILITGATGLVGSLLTRKLLARGESVRAIVRDAERAADLARLGVDLREGDLTRPESYAAALVGVDTAFLLMPVVPQQTEAESGFIDAAKAAGVSLLVKHSAVGADPNQVGIGGAHGEVERHLAQSGLPHIVVRPTQFMQNLLKWSPPIAQVGALVMPLVDERVRVNLVDVEDVADVEAVALTGGAALGRVYIVAGPELLTYEEVAERLSRGVGARIAFERVSPDELRSIVRRVGARLAAAEAEIAYLSTLRTGQTALTVSSDDVQRVAGHPPRSVEEFARDHAAALRPIGAELEPATPP